MALLPRLLDLDFVFFDGEGGRSSFEGGKASNLAGRPNGGGTRTVAGDCTRGGCKSKDGSWMSIFASFPTAVGSVGCCSVVSFVDAEVLESSFFNFSTGTMGVGGKMVKILTSESISSSLPAIVLGVEEILFLSVVVEDVRGLVLRNIFTLFGIGNLSFLLVDILKIVAIVEFDGLGDVNSIPEPGGKRC